MAIQNFRFHLILIFLIIFALTGMAASSPTIAENSTGISAFTSEIEDNSFEMVNMSTALQENVTNGQANTSNISYETLEILDNSPENISSSSPSITIHEPSQVSNNKEDRKPETNVEGSKK